MKKFVNSFNSLLPRLSEIRPQSAQQRIKRIYELFSIWDKTHLVVMKKFVNSFNSLLNKKPCYPHGQQSLVKVTFLC